MRRRLGAQCASSIERNAPGSWVVERWAERRVEVTSGVGAGRGGEDR